MRKLIVICRNVANAPKNHSQADGYIRDYFFLHRKECPVAFQFL
jgi:hypothetical protein